MNFLVLLIAVSLSMDAFSLSLAYGMSGVTKKQVKTLSLTVGIFHFFMPLLGMVFGELFFKNIAFNYHLLVFLILSFIGIQMVLDAFKEKEIKPLKKYETLFFALAVSIDSFSVGITLTEFNKNFIISAVMFALVSFLFTFIGLKIGNKIAKSIGKISTFFGGSVLIIIGVTYLL